VNVRDLEMCPAPSVGNLHRGLPGLARVPSRLLPLGQIAINSLASLAVGNSTPVGSEGHDDIVSYCTVAKLLEIGLA
jgi:hypothetical protein